ncbi:MAG: hypothetical protein F6J97_02935 [Leptolyngbya sp. SIO4C1]|nr:hypothetical protein [Leptolyngbya sp. SIO4C1]
MITSAESLHCGCSIEPLKPQLPDSGYRPDVAVLDKTQLAQEPFWASASTVQFGRTVPLVVEVVSTNWRDDYAHKLVEGVVASPSSAYCLSVVWRAKSGSWLSSISRRALKAA